MSRARTLVALALTTLVVSSCASLTVDKLPLPGMGSPSGYDIAIEFANVLNLPEHADVMLDGSTVGAVTNVVNQRDFVEVTARIDPSVEVPSNTHARLQQATVLGDTYVSLERPSGETSAPALGPGGRVSIAHTTAPPQLEETISNLATFVTSGSIQRVQRSIINVNGIMPDRDQIREISSRISADLGDLSNNIDLVDTWLHSVSDTVNVVNDRTADYLEWFSPLGARMWDRITALLKTLNAGFNRTGSIYNSGYWLVPLLNSVGEAAGAIQGSKWAYEEEWPAWRRLFTETFLPQDKYPAINITSIIGPDGRELSENVHDVLRVLGATP